MKNEELLKKREHSVLHDKSYKFALRIVKMCQFLVMQKKESVLSKQVLRSGTAIGALIRESEFAQSPSDFINKLSISLKEANETDYWIHLLYDSKYIDEQSFNSMTKDCGELIALLVSSINTKKKKLKDVTD